MEFKVLVVKNRLTDSIDWKIGLDWFLKNTPIKIVIDEISTDWDITFRKVGNLQPGITSYTGVVADGYQSNLKKIVSEGKYHCVCFLYGNNPPDVRLSIGENEPLYIGTDIIQVVAPDKGQTFNHELIHIFFKRLARLGIQLFDPMDVAIVNGKAVGYYNDKSIDAPESNRTIAVAALKPYWARIVEIPKKTTISSIISSVINTITPTKPKYKYFKESEIVGLSDQLVQILDKSRELSKTSYIITSGYRTKEVNKAVGGVSNSSHTKGLAVDLACSDNFKRTAILSGLYNCGSDLFIEVCSKHIHVDIDSSKHVLGQTMHSNDD